MWLIAALGIAFGVGGLSQSGLTCGAFGVSAILVLVGLLAVAALFGVGPLREKEASQRQPHHEAQNEESPVGDSPADQLIRFVRLRDSGEITQEEFEVAKDRILNT